MTEGHVTERGVGRARLETRAIEGIAELTKPALGIRTKIRKAGLAHRIEDVPIGAIAGLGLCVARPARATSHVITKACALGHLGKDLAVTNPELGQVRDVVLVAARVPELATVVERKLDTLPLAVGEAHPPFGVWRHGEAGSRRPSPAIVEVHVGGGPRAQIVRNKALPRDTALGTRGGLVTHGPKARKVVAPASKSEPHPQQ